MTRSTDAELVPRLVAQDEEAVALLLERYWARVFRAAGHRTGDPG